MATPGNTSNNKQSTNHKQDSVQSKLLRRLLSSDCGILKSETRVHTLQSNLTVEAAGADKTSIYFHQTIRLHITRRQPPSPIPPDYTASHYKAPTIFTDSTSLYGFTLQGANHLHRFHQTIRLHITRRQPSSPIPPDYTVSHYKAPTIFTDNSTSNFNLLSHSYVFRSKLITRKTKERLYQTVIRPVVVHGSECWVLTENIKQKLLVFQRRLLRRIFGPTQKTNGEW